MKRLSLFVFTLLSAILVLSSVKAAEMETTPRLVVFEAFMRPT